MFKLIAKILGIFMGFLSWMLPSFLLWVLCSLLMIVVPILMKPKIVLSKNEDFEFLKKI